MTPEAHEILSRHASILSNLHYVAWQVTEEMLQCLIKYIFDGLLTDAEMSLDFRSSSYAIVVVLLENATLSNKLLSGKVCFASMLFRLIVHPIYVEKCKLNGGVHLPIILLTLE